MTDSLTIDTWWHERAWNLDEPVGEAGIDFTVPDEDAVAKKAKSVVRLNYGTFELKAEPFEELPAAPVANIMLDTWVSAVKNKFAHQEVRTNYAAPHVVLPLLEQQAGYEPLAALTEAYSSGNKTAIPGHLKRSINGCLGALGLRAVWSSIDAGVQERFVAALRGHTPDLNGYDDAGWLFLASATGELDAEVQAALEQVNEGVCSDIEGRSHWSHPRDLFCLFGATPEERVALADKHDSNVAVNRGAVIAWLLNTGELGIDRLVLSLSRLGKDDAKEAMATLKSAVDGPAAVRIWAALLDTRHAAEASVWLTANTDAVLALEPDTRTAALLAPTLRTVPVDKLRASRDSVAETLWPIVDAIIADADTPEFDPETPWWKEALAAADDPGKKKLPPYVAGMALPALRIGGTRLGEREHETLLRVLMTSERDHPLLAAIRENVPAAARDDFALGMLKVWLANGAESKGSWLLTSAGSVGDDRFVNTLTPLIREWPGQSQHKRAVKGLTALRNVGTTVALQQIAGIAAKVKFAAIKKRANEAMEEIADALGFTRDELEDRIIPDSGLDARGTRTFSYGPREFLAALTPDGKVSARLIGTDGLPTGKPKASLPAPNQSDDAELAAQSKADYAQLKKNVSAVAKIQKARFESAMISGRRWTAEEFGELLAPNPLVRSLLAGVVCGVFEGDARVALGRLDSDGTLLDADDEPIGLSGRSVGIVHPIELSEEEKSRWSEVLTDYELMEVFPQLAREVFTLPADQGDDLDLHGVPGEELEAGRMLGAFSKGGWERGAFADAGVYHLHARKFVAANVTAFINYADGMYAGSVAELSDQTIEHVYLLEGLHDGEDFDYGWTPVPYYLNRDTYRHVPWSKAAPTVVSEVFRTLESMRG